MINDKIIKPMLCQLRGSVFNDPDYIWERKYDGVRVIASINDGSVTLQGRSGLDKTMQFPELQDIAVSVKEATLDGEIVSANGKSFQDFAQHRVNRLDDIILVSEQLPAVYVVFDLLSHDGLDITTEHFCWRRYMLEKVLVPSSIACYTKQYEDGVALYQTAVSEKWEGVVGKRLDEPYLYGKRRWLKVKIWQEDIFTAYGYTPGRGKREGLFGALLLKDKDKEVGEVGTGFTDSCLMSLLSGFEILDKLDKFVLVSPFSVRIKYLERSNSGQLRFPVFKGIVNE